jgi:Carboxypeptidase regulatory-like domain
MGRPFCLCVFALVIALELGAQAPANLRGVVTDPSGAAVPGASVNATGPGELVSVAETDNRGVYTINGLPPGSYIIRIAARGFAFFESMPVELTAARANTADARLALAAEKQEITVADSTQVELNPSKNAGATVLKGSDLDILSDDPNDLENDLQTLAGPSAGPNGGQIFVDGFSNGQLPPKDSIREIRVNSNPFAAEFDSIGYGRVEILTKPGSDQLHGSVFYQTDTATLDARNPFANVKPAFLTRQFQGNAGGAINRKTSFFVDFSDRHQDDQALIHATILDSNFQPAPFTQNVSTPTSRLSISPRIDYQAGSNVTLQGRYTWTRVTSDNQGVGGFNLATQSVNSETTSQSAQLTGTWLVNNRAVNESRFQYTRSANSQSSLNDAPTIVVSGFFVGGGATQGPQYTNRGSYEVQNYTSLTRGNHLLKFGVRLRVTREDDFNDTNFNGVFRFGSLSDYAATLQGAGFKALQYLRGAGNPLLHISQTDVAPYIQDDWRVVPGFTLSLGLRYEAQTNIHDHGNFAPRIGVAWAPGGSRGGLRQPKTVVRAGFGFFYDRFGLAQVLNAERFNGVVQQGYVIPNPAFFVGNIPPLSEIGSVQPPIVYTIDSGLVAPRIMQSAIGVDRQLPGNVTLSLNYTDSRGLHQLRTRDINAPLPGTYPLNPVFPMGKTNPVYQYESSGAFKQNQFTVNVNARLNSRYSMFGFYNLGFAHSNTDGVGTFPADSYDLSAEWSRAQFDVRHRFLIGGSITAPLGIRLSPMVTFASAAPFNIVVVQDLNGDTIVNDRPSFASAASIAASNAAVAAGQHPFVYATPYGFLNAQPAPGELEIPRNFGEGFGSLSINLRVARTWGFGETTTGAANGGRRGGSSGRTGGAGGFGGLRPGGGRGGFLAGAASNRRYNVTIGIEARNLLNSVNPGRPIGILESPQFGQAQEVANGFFGRGSSQSSNRRLEMQLRLSF